MKLYFFKTYLKQDNVNQLRWVEFKADGRKIVTDLPTPHVPPRYDRAGHLLPPDRPTEPFHPCA